MENLGAMEIDRLFQLFVGVLIGAAVIVVFIVVYVVISRRGDKAKRRMRLGTGTEKQATGPAEFGEEARPIVASPMATTA